MRASEISPKKLVVFDIDDTLVHTQTKVHVIKDGEVIDSLNSHDFTHYKLKPGESFDFKDFRNAREFFEKSKPIIPMMRQLKQDIATGNKVVMVTARADFDDRELFLDTFRKFGIDMSKVHVYRAGNSKEGTTEERKKAIIKQLLDQEDYSKAIMYDDAKPNLHTFIELKKDHPRTRFYAWHVSLEGEASEYMRESIVAEKKKRKKNRWAAYGPGPFGGYGFAAGYSGDGGIGEDQDLTELNVAATLKFIKDAHGDQLYGKLPYWRHPRAVAMTGRKIFGSRFNSEAVKAAFLHDVVEDTDTDLSDLEELGFSDRVIEAVSLLTKDSSLTYFQNIDRIIGSGNEIAQMVKYADNYENYTGDKSDWAADRAASSNEKYLKSLNKLGDHLGVKHHIDEPKNVKEDRTADVMFDTGEQRKVRYHPTSKDIVDTIIRYYLKQGLRVVKIDNEKIEWDDVAENFADGKVKGKSRPGRVKRAGVPSGASISRLRQIAKTSSGEKAKMAHWMANMKSGRGK
jgi:FMN phosphatase YigB (HAD superfamily)